MNILFTRFPLESAYGGAEKQVISLMQGLKQRGHDVSFLGSCPVLLEQCKKLKIENEKLKIGDPPVTKLGAFTFLWKKHLMKKRLVHHFQYSIFNIQSDAVIMISLTEKILLTPYALAKGIKVIWLEHDKVGRWLTKNPWLPELKKMSADVTTVTVSELSANIFRNLGYKNVIAIPNGVEITSNESQVTSSEFTVGCIARLSPEKGVDILIEAVKDLSSTTLIILGQGSEEQKLQDMVNKPRITDHGSRITIIPHIKNVEDFYKEIDVLILPSREEDPFGLVVAEAMMRGIATICTDACGIAGYLKDGVDALIVPAGDKVALAEAIERMENGEWRMEIAQRGKRTAMEKFTIERMVERYEELLQCGE